MTPRELPLVGAPESDGILVGMLLVAVQKVRDATVESNPLAATLQTSVALLNASGSNTWMG